MLALYCVCTCLAVNHSAYILCADVVPARGNHTDLILRPGHCLAHSTALTAIPCYTRAYYCLPTPDWRLMSRPGQLPSQDCNPGAKTAWPLAAQPRPRIRGPKPSIVTSLSSKRLATFGVLARCGHMRNYLDVLPIPLLLGQGSPLMFIQYWAVWDRPLVGVALDPRKSSDNYEEIQGP